MRPDAVVCHRIDRATRFRRWFLRIGTLVLGTVAALVIVGTAHAFWTTGGVGFGSATTATLTPATNVVVSSPPGSDSVSVGWSAASVSSGGVVNGYYVLRAPAEGGAQTPACGTSPTSPTSTLSCTDLGVPDGSYRYVVMAVLGSWTAMSMPSEPVTVRLNADVPSVVATTSPAPNTNGYNRTSPVTIQLSATDSDGIASIVYRINGGAPVTVTAATASIPLSGDGTWTVTYSATDNLGKTSPNGTRVVRIDTVAPAAPAAPTLATNSDTGISASDRITNDRTPTFTGSAEPGASVRLFVDGVQVGTAVVPVTGIYSVTSGHLLGEGTRSVTVRLVDLADNVGALSTSTSITVDLTGPSITPTGLLLESVSDTGRSSKDRITADNTPDIFGSGRNSGADYLVLYAGDVQVGVAAATPTATITAAQLADGVHAMTMRGSDVAGNLSLPSSEVSITIDTVAPPTPSAPTLTAASDTGASSTDRVTNDSTPTVTGSGEASVTVVISVGGTEVGSQNTTSTSYSVTTTALSDGQHTFTATAVDVAGNSSPAASGATVTIDTTAPTAPSAPVVAAASDSGGSSADRVTNDNTPTFTGTATTGTNVTVYAGTVATGGTVNAAGGSWTVTAGTLQDGVHAVTARTDADLAGNVGVSASTTVTIDTTAPSTPAAPTLMAASDTGRSSADRVTNDTTPTFSGPGSAGVVSVQLYDGGALVGSATANPAYTVTASPLTNGAHSMAVRVFDLAGNVSASSAAQAITIDTVAPAAPTAPALTAESDTGASSSDRVTSDATPTLTGTNESSARVTLYAGASQVGTEITSSTSYSITATPLSDGVHSLTATATDIAGNVGGASSATSITVDTTAPTAPSAPVLTAADDSGVSADDRVTNRTTLTFTGTATSGSNVRLFDSASPTGQVVVASGGAYTATTGTVSSGSRSFTARTDPDLAGNVGISAVTTVTVDTTAPTVTITPNTATTATRFNVAFNETVHDLTSADITVSGTANPTTNSVSGTGGSYVVQVSGMDRTGTVVVALGGGSVTDTAGNANAASSSSSTTYTDSQQPTVAITGFVAAGGQTALVEGTVSTNPGDPSTVRVVLCTATAGDCSSNDTKATLTATVTPGTGAWSVTSGDLGPTDGLYAQAEATDLSGNTRLSSPAGPINIPAATTAATAAARTTAHTTRLRLEAAAEEPGGLVDVMDTSQKARLERRAISRGQRSMGRRRR